MSKKKPELTVGGSERLPLARKMLDGRCASQHYGAWAVESKWFQAAIASVRNGTLKPEATAYYDDDTDGKDEPLYEIRDGVAIICIDGQMTKRGSSFGGCSTVAVRHALRQAAMDYTVNAIVMYICSPGGTVAGTADLADDVLAVREGRIGKGKPVTAYIADMGCSAAYWVGSQCEYIYANKTAMVGSIGTYTVLEDDTKWQEDMGIKWRVVSTGPFKGLGADGAVSDQLIADVQREVNELNKPFLSAVSVGRAGRIGDIATIADGRAHVAEQALSLGLIDEIASLEAAITATSLRRKPMNPTEQVKAIAADHPEAVASFIEQGKKVGKAEASTEERARVLGIMEAHSMKDHAAVASITAGHDIETAKLIADTAAKAKADAEAKAKTDADAAAAKAAEQAAEIKRLQFEAGGQKPIGAVAAKPVQSDQADAEALAEAANESDPEKRAKAEWAADKSLHSSFQNEAAFVAYRKAELAGQIRMTKTAK